MQTLLGGELPRLRGSPPLPSWTQAFPIHGGVNRHVTSAKSRAKTRSHNSIAE